MSVLPAVGTTAPLLGVKNPAVLPGVVFPSLLDERNGVANTVFGVEIVCAWGITPLKSELCNGVFKPPFKGVSTCVSAIIF